MLNSTSTEYTIYLSMSGDVVQALRNCLSASISRDERKSSEKIISDIRNTVDCGEIFLRVVQMPLEDSIHVLSLSILYLWVLDWWMEIPPQYQLCVREEVMIFFKRGGDWSKALRTKLALLIAAIAIHQYPTQWPEFFTDIVHIWMHSLPPIQHVVLMVIEFTVSDVTDTGGRVLPRQRVISQICTQAISLLAITYQYIAQCLNHVSGGDPTLFPLLQAAISMLNAVLKISKTRVITADTNYYSLLTPLILVPNLQADIIVFLESASYCESDPDITLQSLQAVLSHPLSLSPDDIDDEAIQLARDYSNAVYSVFSNQMHVFSSTASLSSGGAPDIVMAYLSYLVQTANQNRRRVAMDAINHWVKVISQFQLYCIFVALVDVSFFHWTDL